MENLQTAKFNESLIEKLRTVKFNENLIEKSINDDSESVSMEMKKWKH